jgi:peptide alpha-N-acetyltransferase
MVQAQELDTADRYLNSKCAKYLLLAGRIKDAEQMCAKFTRENTNATESLNDMQCMWYELHCANAHYSLGQYGEALKKCHQVEKVRLTMNFYAIDLFKHFVSFYEDQYDFHSYCIRKATLCSYMKILRFEEEIRGQRHYIRAAKLAAKVLFTLVDIIVLLFYSRFISRWSSLQKSLWRRSSKGQIICLKLSYESCAAKPTRKRRYRRKTRIHKMDPSKIHR